MADTRRDYVGISIPQRVAPYRSTFLNKTTNILYRQNSFPYGSDWSADNSSKWLKIYSEEYISKQEVRITHNLGTKIINVDGYNNTKNISIVLSYEIQDDNTILLIYPKGLNSEDHRIVIIG